MTVQTTEQTPASSAWSDEAEIDLRQYIDVLVRWWREIGLITLVAVILSIVTILVLQGLETPTYEASAEVALVRTVSDIQFDERFTTQPEETTTSSASARRLALVVLANSSDIAQAVIAQLDEQLDPTERNVDQLLGMVEATVSSPEGISSNESDLIRIEVTSDSPEKSAAIANAWAQIYVRQANAVYGQVPDELFASVQAEQTKAEGEYITAQMNLEQFLGTSRSDELNRLILEKQAQIDAYSASATANRLAAFTAEQNEQRNVLNSYLTILSGVQDTVFSEQADQSSKLLQNYSSGWITTTLGLENARALHTQVEQGGDAAARSSVLALQLLKVTLFGGSQNRVELQLPQPAATTADEMLRDLDGLIAALETRQANLETQIEQLAQTMLSGDNFVQLGQSIPLSSTLAQTIQQKLPSLLALGEFSQQSEALANGTETAETGVPNSITQKLVDLQVELRMLKSQFEAETALQLQLTQRRDLSWETLKTLSNKMAELNLTRAASNSEVRFAASAVAPTDPMAGPSLLLSAAGAGVLGLMLAILIALLANYMRQPPFLRRNQQASAMSFDR